MAEPTVIVVGAGLAGLACGCYAQMNGFHSRILEHAHAPGGVAAAWRRGDYLIDGGIHFLMGHGPGQTVDRLYRELGTAQNNVRELTSYGRFVNEPAGFSLDVTPDLNRLASDLRAVSPGDASRIDGLMHAVGDMRGSDLFATMVSPPELTGPFDSLRAYWGMRRTLKYYSGEYARPMSDFCRTWQSPVLRDLLLSLFTPEVPAWFVVSLLAMLADGQLALLTEGCRGFVEPIVSRYAKLGGDIQFGATVETVLVENGRAAGVRLSDGSEYRADAVVSAADGRSTIFRMLGGSYADRAIRRVYDTWKPIRPTVIVSLGVSMAVAREPHLLQLRLANPIQTGDVDISNLTVRVLNYSDAFAPAGKTVVQGMLEASWEDWNGLRQAGGSAYADAKARLAEDVIDRLEAHYPGIGSAVEMVDVATPYTTWRYTRNDSGAYMGWLPTPEALMTPIRHTLPGLGSFYMAGQWVVPGGGVAPCLFSGRHAIQLLCRDERRSFTATALPAPTAGGPRT